jgi:opacity protein-like surface antigen
MRNCLIPGLFSRSIGSARRIGAGLLVGIATMLAATSASAAEPASRGHNYEITPFAGHMFGGEFEDPTDKSERDLDANTNFGVIFDATAAGDYWRHYELIYSRQSTEIDGAVPLDLDVQYLQIGGIVSNPDAKRVIPYFGMTVGATQFSPDQSGFDDETKLSFSVGGGVRVPITDRIGVRFDARAFITLLDSDGQIFCVSSAGATCNISVKSDTFVQYSASLGLMIGF